MQIWWCRIIIHIGSIDLKSTVTSYAPYLDVQTCCYGDRTVVRLREDLASVPLLRLWLRDLLPLCLSRTHVQSGRCYLRFPLLRHWTLNWGRGELWKCSALLVNTCLYAGFSIDPCSFGFWRSSLGFWIQSSGLMIPTAPEFKVRTQMKIF